MTIYSFSYSGETPVTTPKDQLKEIVADYYQSMNSNQIEKLPQFLSPQVTSWYGEQNPSREWIYRNAKAHRGKYPYSSSDIDWDSFTVIPAETGGYTVTYEMIYRSKEKITDDYTVYDLKLLTQWDDNFKLRGITEIRN
jgi:ketosteroid isomerase-like protein